MGGKPADADWHQDLAGVERRACDLGQRRRGRALDDHVGMGRQLQHRHDQRARFQPGAVRTSFVEIARRDRGETRLRDGACGEASCQLLADVAEAGERHAHRLRLAVADHRCAPSTGARSNSA
jgi:hypothetical protein